MLFRLLNNLSLFLLLVCTFTCVQVSLSQMSPRFTPDITSRSQIDSLNQLALTLINADVDRATTLSNIALRKSDSLNYHKGRVDAKTHLGILDYKAGRLHEAKELLGESLSLYKRMSDEKGEMKSTAHMAVVHAKLGDFVEAQSFNFQFLSLAERLDDDDQLTKAYQNIGNIYFSQNEMEKADEYYVRALELARHRNDSMRMSILYYNIGHIKLRNKEYEEALAHYQNSYDISIGGKNKRRIAQSLEAIGVAWKRMGQLQKAMPMVIEAKSLYAEMKDDYRLINTHLFLAEIYSEQGRHNLSIDEINNSISLSKKLDALKKQQDSYKIAKKIYQAANQPRTALLYADSAQIIGDSIWTGDKFKAIQELNEKYNTEKKETQIALLEKDQKILRSKNRLHFLLAISLFMIIGLLSYMYWSIRKKNAKLFLQLQGQMHRKLDEKTTVPSPEVHASTRKTAPEIPGNVKKDILIQLKNWESQKKFLDPVDRQELSKELGTNTKYLSLVIKDIHGLPFNEYLNNLRIAYVLEELQYDQELRNYTLDHISTLAGFGSRKTFTTAFKRYTGLLPSFYIRELKAKRK